MKDLERRILDVEGFRVRVRHARDGRDVRSDNAKLRRYPYKRALKHSKSVKAWREGDSSRVYPGFSVDVLDAEGGVAHGRTLLGTVRDGYLAEE